MIRSCFFAYHTINSYHNEELLWNPELNATKEAKEQARWGFAAFFGLTAAG